MWFVYVFMVRLMTSSTAEIMIASNYDLIWKLWIVKDVEWSVEAGGGVNVVYFKVIHMKAKIKKELLNIYGKPTILTPNTFQMIVKGITNAMQNYS
jgi:hypothetical protein